ncbi:flavoprotein, partial [Streptomyces albidoflavus]|uniref:flavoprotein n=1 Tax=Streptomyces albidoflavus TaxID=1886 RepID=UPI0027B938F5
MGHSTPPAPDARTSRRRPRAGPGRPPDRASAGRWGASAGAPARSAPSGQPVSTEDWDDGHEVPHVRIGQQADLVVVAPATADVLAKAAHGLADDLLTNTLL